MIASDTTSLNYAVLIGEIETVRRLYGRVTIPQAVQRELLHERTPRAVREWMQGEPDWIEVREVKGPFDASLMALGPGEREAIALAEAARADGLPMDERDGYREARRRKLPLVGLLGVLRDAGAKGLTDFDAALERLKSLERPRFFLSPNVEATIRRQYRELLQAQAERQTDQGA